MRLVLLLQQDTRAPLPATSWTPSRSTAFMTTSMGTSTKLTIYVSRFTAGGLPAVADLTGEVVGEAAT